jgi:hypothetical protein
LICLMIFENEYKLRSSPLRNFLPSLVTSFLSRPNIPLRTLFSNTLSPCQGRGVHVTGVSAAYTFKLNKNILSE